MPYLTGEFECKLDPKSRMMIPSGLKKKLPEIETEGFVIARSFGSRKHLQVHTKKDWDGILDTLSKLNQYDEENIKVIRYFMRGATELVPDAVGRVVLPKFLKEYAGIETDIVITLQVNRIELWGAETYAQVLEDEPDNFAPTIQKVLGSKNAERNGHE